MAEEQGKHPSRMNRLLYLWGKWVDAGSLSNAEKIELLNEAREFVFRSPIVSGLPKQDREDVAMEFLMDKLICAAGPERAPYSQTELNTFVRNYLIDRKRRPSEDPLPPDLVARTIDEQTTRQSCGNCSTSDFSALAAEPAKRTIIEKWLLEMDEVECHLLWRIQCAEESATDTFSHLRILNGSAKVKRLGLRLTRAHADGHWRPSAWLKNTRLGRLFQQLSITLERDMLADARQALGLLCAILASRYGR